jgi:hypothetical protein
VPTLWVLLRPLENKTIARARKRGRRAKAKRFGYKGPKSISPQGYAANAITHIDDATKYFLSLKIILTSKNIEQGKTTADTISITAFKPNASEQPDKETTAAVNT